MSVINRLEIVRKKVGLNKSQFEISLGKSTGYLKLTEKRQSHPGTDVLIKFSKMYPEISLRWLLTGEGEMMNKEGAGEEKPLPINQTTTLLDVRDDLKKEMKENFNTIHEALFEGLKSQQQLLKFTNQLDPDMLSKLMDKMAEEFKIK